MQYRVLESLRYLNSSERIEAGAISDLKRLSPKTIKMLLAKNRIAEVHPPPLSALEGFKGERAEAYAEKGILDINDMTGEEPDFEEAKAWSAGDIEPDTWMSRPIGEDVSELKEVDDDELDSEV